MRSGLAEPRSSGRPRLVTVHGSPSFLAVIDALFEAEDLHVSAVADVSQTIDRLAVLASNLLIVDLAVRQPAGWTLLERLHGDDATRSIPILVTSKEQWLLDRAQADPRRYGEHPVMVKPLEVIALMGVVDDLLGRA